MALRFARDGANIVIAAKSAKPHPKLKGTIYDVAREVESAGGQALPFQVDVRFESQVAEMVTAAVDKFGKVDHSRDPHQQAERKQERDAKPNVSNRARASVNPSARRRTMNLISQSLGRDIAGQLDGLRV